MKVWSAREVTGLSAGWKAVGGRAESESSFSLALEKMRCKRNWGGEEEKEKSPAHRLSRKRVVGEQKLRVVNRMVT